MQKALTYATKVPSKVKVLMTKKDQLMRKRYLLICKRDLLITKRDCSCDTYAKDIYMHAKYTNTYATDTYANEKQISKIDQCNYLQHLATKCHTP